MLNTHRSSKKYYIFGDVFKLAVILKRPQNGHIFILQLE